MPNYFVPQFKSLFIKLLYSFILLLHFSYAFSQNKAHFDIKSGLISNRINAICVDDYGQFWIGTDSGLQLFDNNVRKGQRIFHDGKIEGMTLPGDSIYSIEQAPDGRLWVGTNNGVGILDLKQRKIKTLSNLVGESLFVKDIQFDSIGGVYLKHDYTLSYVDKSGSITPIVISNWHIRDIKMDDDFNLWLLATNNDWTRSIIRINNINEVKFCHFVKESFSSEASWESGRKWIFNSNNEYNALKAILIKMPDGKVVLKRHPNLQYFSINPGLNPVIQEIEKQELEEYTSYYDFITENETLDWGYQYNSKLRHSFFLTHNGIYIYADSEFGFVRGTMGESHRGMYELSDGSLLISTYAGITKLDLKTNSIVKRGFYQPFLSMTEISSDLLISGVDWKGISVLNKASLHLTRTNVTELVSVGKIIKDKNGLLYIGHKHGLHTARYRIQGDSVNIELEDHYLKDENILTLHQNTNGAILIGTENGLYILDNQNENSTSIKISKLSVNESVFHIYEDVGNNKIWLGTLNNGILILDKEYNVLDHKTRKNSKMLDDRVISINSINDSVFWVSTYKAISMVDQQGGVIKNYPILTFGGIEEFNRYSSLLTKDSVMYLGGVNGAVYFKLEDLEKRSNDNKILLSGISLINEDNGKDTLIENYNGLLKKVNLDARNKLLEFQISSNDFTTPLRYNYRLKGFDNKWKLGTSPSVRYTNLNPGEYQFELSKQDSNSNQINSSITLLKSQLFYKSNWFYFLVITLIALIASLIRSRILRSKRKLIELKEHVSADLHDDLGYTLSKIYRNVQSVKNNLSSNSQISKLDEISKSSLVAINSLSRIIWVLDGDDKTIIEVYEKMKIIISEILNEKQDFCCKLNVEENQKGNKLKSELCNHLIMITKEAALNIQKHTVSEKVIFSMTYNYDLLSIEFKNEFSKTKKDVRSSNRGIKNMKRRVEEMNGEFGIKKNKDSFVVSINIKS